MNGSSAMDRRAFLEGCSLLLLSLTGCARVLSHTRFARLAVNDPHPDEYLPVLRSIVLTVLPFEHPGFPALTPEAVQRRVLEMFPIDRDADYAALRRALVVFDAVDLFAELEPPMASDEREQARAAGLQARAVEADLADKVASDAQLYRDFLAAGGNTRARAFTSLSHERRLDYLRLWSRSAFTAKRRFYQGAKHLVMVAAYTTPELWSAIGYAGPLLGSRS